MFRALLKALDDVGKPPPPELKLPSGVATVINWAQLGMEYQKTDPREQDEDIGKYRNRIKARTRRFREDLLKYNVIGIAEMRDPTAVNDDVDKPKTDSLRLADRPACPRPRTGVAADSEKEAGAKAIAGSR